MACTTGLPGLDESGGPVVGYADLGQRRQYRGLASAVPAPAWAAGRNAGQRLRRRTDAAALRGVCVRLRLPLGPAARGRAADLPVRYLAVERVRRPFGG